MAIESKQFQTPGHRSNATQIAEAIYDALKSHGYLAESTT